MDPEAREVAALFVAMLDALRAWDDKAIGHNGTKNCPACKCEDEIAKVLIKFGDR
jgi:hypothetical protein